MPAKPSSKPQWTETNPGVRVEPDGAYKNTGWFSNIRPPYQFMNWLFYNIGVQWLNYFEAVTDSLVLAPAYDFAVGTGGTYADLNAAMADSAVVAGSRLLVVSNLALTGTQVINKNNIEVVLKPGVILSDAGANIGVQISANRVRIHGGKMTGFATEAILIDAGSNYSLIGEMMFQGNASDIVDNNGKGATYGLIAE